PFSGLVSTRSRVALAPGGTSWRRIFIMLLISLFAAPASAQDQCGTVTSIAFPVDPAAFRIVQDFGVPSPRHQGRYHTGEDWYGGRGTSYGQPVRAIADGRVTYSAPTGWGRDGGVVIIEHTFPDGSVAYSMYGHMEQTDTHPFPARYGCIKAGEVVGTVGNARPAPHLHFEIRVNQPDVPGAGYTPTLPDGLGWREPSQFVQNWTTWLSAAYAWHLDAGTNLIAPPLELPDHSLLFLDSTRLRDSTPDGRVLWRINLETPGVGLSWLDGAPLLTYANGIMQLINFDGTLGARWPTNIALESPPILASDLLLFHTPDNTLVAFAPDRQTVAWRLENVPPIRRVAATPNIIGLMTEGNLMLSVSPAGQLLDRAQLNGLGSLSTAPGDNLLAYVEGGLWQIDGSGTWTSLKADAPPAGESSAALRLEDGRTFVVSGEESPFLYAFNPDGSPIWQVATGELGGVAHLSQYGNVLLLTTTFGHIQAYQADSGAVCNRAQVYGDSRSREWHNLGDDGILRVAVADQILGLNWGKFIGGCTP
ncbi:MAG: peptidoglycan DD-metalloendopeptidase family protein, partial [Anaerolineae bacterium]|nr:peptidoglycan DD-metalloendopeptidase family protein [Anaerolineae bacterium]